MGINSEPNRGSVQPHASADAQKTPDLSRRKFLRIMGGVAAGAALVGVAGGAEASLAERGLVGLGSGFIRGSEAADSQLMTDAAAELSGGKENVGLRPISALVAEGITAYERKPEEHPAPFYTKNPDYKNAEFYAQALDRVRNQLILPMSPTQLADLFEQQFPEAAKQVFETSKTYSFDYSTILPKDSGMYQRISVKDKPLYENGVIDTLKLEAKKYLIEAKLAIELAVKDNHDQPVSASKVLEFFLGKNHGDIRLSLQDTYTFLKFAARNNYDSGWMNGSGAASAENVRWMQQHIKDEYGDTDYAAAGLDSQVANNLTGKPYHAWNLIALLPLFPQQVIDLAGLYWQVKFLSDQGADKIQSDLTALADLPAVEKVLQGYERPEILTKLNSLFRRVLLGKRP